MESVQGVYPAQVTSLFIKSFKGKLRVLGIDRLRKITINKGREKKVAADVNEVGIKKIYSQPFLNERRCLTCNYGLLYSKPAERLNIICTFLMLPPSSASYHYHMLHSLSRTLEKLYTDLSVVFFSPYEKGNFSQLSMDLHGIFDMKPH